MIQGGEAKEKPTFFGSFLWRLSQKRTPPGRLFVFIAFPAFQKRMSPLQVIPFGMGSNPT